MYADALIYLVIVSVCGLLACLLVIIFERLKGEDDGILMVPAHSKPKLSERQLYWIIGGALVGTILILVGDTP